MSGQELIQGTLALRHAFTVNSRLQLEFTAQLSRLLREHGVTVSDELLRELILAVPDELLNGSHPGNGNGSASGLVASSTEPGPQTPPVGPGPQTSDSPPGPQQPPVGPGPQTTTGTGPGPQTTGIGPGPQTTGTGPGPQTPDGGVGPGPQPPVEGAGPGPQPPPEGGGGSETSGRG